MNDILGSRVFCFTLDSKADYGPSGKCIHLQGAKKFLNKFA